MGGRGASSGNRGARSGNIGGLKVDAGDDFRETYYFDRGPDGTYYYRRNLGAIAEPTPSNMSMKEFENRMRKNGAKVERISKKEYEKAEKAYNKAQRERPDYEAGTGLLDNRVSRKNARINRLNTRMQRRKK